jgi:hypothetical protein
MHANTTYTVFDGKFDNFFLKSIEWQPSFKST